MGRTLGANAVAQSMQHRTQSRIGVMAVVGAEPLHDVFEPEIGFLHRLVEDVEACGHVATSSQSWPARLRRAEATALMCIKRYFRRSICFGSSRMTSVAFLSVLSPRHTGWRISPAAVHSVNLTSATSLGFTQVVFASSGTFSTTGFLAVMSGTIFWCRERSVSASKPVPARPAYSQRFPSRTASTSAPKYLRLLRGAVKPTITTSCSWLALTLSQSRVRAPEW